MQKSLGPCHYWGVAPWRRAVTPGTTVVVVVVAVVVVVVVLCCFFGVKTHLSFVYALPKVYFVQVWKFNIPPLNFLAQLAPQKEAETIVFQSSSHFSGAFAGVTGWILKIG